MVCQRFIIYPFSHVLQTDVSLAIALQKCQSVTHATAFQGCERTNVRARRAARLRQSEFVPGVNTALMLASVSWASTYPTIPHCRSPQYELCAL